MKALVRFTTVVSIIFILSSQAQANDRGVNGLIIGSGTGAILGQAVGRNVESTLIGATLGGVLGAVIASESSYGHQNIHRIHQRPRGPHGRDFNRAPRHAPPRVIFNPPHFRDHHFHGDRVIIVEKHHGRKHIKRHVFRNDKRKFNRHNHDRRGPGRGHNNHW